MRFIACAISLAISFMLPIVTGKAAAQNLPPCNRQVITRNGNEITIGLEQLGNLFNTDLKTAHSNFSELRLTDAGSGKLKVSGMNNGKPVEISGPLQVVSGGELKLHADEITQNGIPEKGLMDLTGKTLADYAHFKDTDILSAKGNDLYIHPDPLLNISGDVTNLSLDNSSVTLRFASPPCR
jgi:hypothetical protein